MMEEQREQERMEFLEREERYLLERSGVSAKKPSGSTALPRPNAQRPGCGATAFDPSRKNNY